MAEEQINKLLDVPGSPRERTCVLGRVPEKLGKGMPFDSRQMISSKYPWLVTIESYGTSHAGRSLLLATITDAGRSRTARWYSLDRRQHPFHGGHVWRGGAVPDPISGGGVRWRRRCRGRGTADAYILRGTPRQPRRPLGGTRDPSEPSSIERTAVAVQRLVSLVRIASGGRGRRW